MIHPITPTSRPSIRRSLGSAISGDSKGLGCCETETVCAITNCLKGGFKIMNLLYYPNILIPVQELNKLVLYSDHISTIVPNEFHFKFGKDIELNQEIIALAN